LKKIHRICDNLQNINKFIQFLEIKNFIARTQEFSETAADAYTNLQCSTSSLSTVIPERIPRYREKPTKLYRAIVYVFHINTNGKRRNKVEDEGRWVTGRGELVAINFYLKGTFALVSVISEMSCNNGALNCRESLSHRNDQSARHCLPPIISGQNN